MITRRSAEVVARATAARHAMPTIRDDPGGYDIAALGTFPPPARGWGLAAARGQRGDVPE